MRNPQDYLTHGSQRPIHLRQHQSASRFVSVGIYERNRRTAILDGVTVRAQRLNTFSRSLNQFTTTDGSVRPAININGKTKTTKKGSLPKLAATLPRGGTV